MKPNHEALKRVISPLVPDLDAQLPAYVVDVSELDDELLAIFIEQMDMDLRALSAALEASDLVTVIDKAHSIKGMGGTADMPEISVLAAETERAGKAADHARMQALTRVLGTCFDIVKTGTTT